MVYMINTVDNYMHWSDTFSLKKYWMAWCGSYSSILIQYSHMHDYSVPDSGGTIQMNIFKH